MPLTVGIEDITQAMKLFETQDYYLECHPTCIYFSWVTTAPYVQKYINHCFECLDIQINENWIDLYGYYEQTGDRYQIPADQTYFSCRYILETN
jgi:hypothetical protein